MKRLAVVAVVVAVLGIGMSAVRAKPAMHQVMQPDQLKWMPAPPMLPRGSQIAMLEGNPMQKGLYTIRLRAPRDYVVPPHWHSKGEHVTVISGTMRIGMGDKVDRSAAHRLPPGAYVNLPARMHHYAVAETDATVQIHGMGPFDIHYLKSSDDPRHHR